MQTTAIITLCALFTISTAVPIVPSTQVVQGPSTKTTVIGPGGTGVIHASAPGGTIVREETPGYVANTGTHGLVASYGSPIVQHSVASVPISYGLSQINGGLVGHGGVLGYSGVLY